LRPLVLLLGSMLVPVGDTAEMVLEQTDRAQTRFQRTVIELQAADPQLRSAFATTALSKMSDAYALEARLARQQAGRGGNSHLAAWSATVDRYASQLPQLIDDIELGLPVRFTTGEEASLAITVGDQTVIVSHPRLNQQSALEQSILTDFCSHQDCKQFSPDDTDASPIPDSTVHVHPSWNFSEQGWNCSHSGITVHFDSDQNMEHARLICEQFMQEVVLFTREIAWQERQGVSIEWDRMDIRPTPQGPEHSVQLNAAGDSMLLTVPLLYATPGLLVQVLPWIRQQVSGGQETSIVLDAGQYGWQNH